MSWDSKSIHCAMKPIRIQLECPYNSSNKKIPMYEFFKFLYTLHKLSGFFHLGLVYSWFCNRALTLPSCLVFGSQHSCLVSGPVLVSCRGSDTHAPGLVLLWERAVSSSLGPCAPLSVCIRCLRFAFSCFLLFCMAHSLCFSLAAYFHVCHVLCEHAAYESPY